MKPARLSSGLLARKGGAAPLAGAYGGTNLEPLIGLFGRGAARPSQWPDASDAARPALSEPQQLRPSPRQPLEMPPVRRNAPVRVSMQLDPERHARLRIMAARKGARPQDLLREVLDTVLAATTDDCPCVRGELPCCGKAVC
jgi:hypothetical protein